MIVSTQKLARALLPAATRTTGCEHVVTIETVASGQDEPDPAPRLGRPDRRRKRRPPKPAQPRRDFKRGDLACIIYTSGTGGAPRGVMQHHGAILHNVEGCVALIAEDFGWDDEIFLSFLPASHAYEHSGGQLFPIGLAAQIYYSEGLEKLASNIEEVRPTIMVVVPRLFEVLRQRILNQVEKQGKLTNYLMGRALSIGAKDYAGSLPVWDRPMDFLLGRTLRPKIAARFGGRIKAMVSGGAPLNPEVGIFFHSLGLTLLQGYGQTEAGPVLSCNRPSVGLKMDTVGPPLKNTEVRIAEDGEILLPRRAGHAGLLAQRGADRAHHRRRLAAHRRRRPYRRARAGS